MEALDTGAYTLVAVQQDTEFNAIALPAYRRCNPSLRAIL